jgi:hypothetical protein
MLALDDLVVLGCAIGPLDMTKLWSNIKNAPFSAIIHIIRDDTIRERGLYQVVVQLGLYSFASKVICPFFATLRIRVTQLDCSSKKGDDGILRKIAGEVNGADELIAVQEELSKIVYPISSQETETSSSKIRLKVGDAEIAKKKQADFKSIVKIILFHEWLKKFWRRIPYCIR